MIYEIITQSGPFYMVTPLLLLAIVLFLFGKALVEDGSSSRTKESLMFIGFFAFFFGLLARVVSFVTAFEMIENAIGIAPQVLFGGLQNSYYQVGLGLVIFLIARVGIIILILKSKNPSSAIGIR